MRKMTWRQTGAKVKSVRSCQDYKLLRFCKKLVNQRRHFITHTKNSFNENNRSQQFHISHFDKAAIEFPENLYFIIIWLSFDQKSSLVLGTENQYLLSNFTPSRAILVCFPSFNRCPVVANNVMCVILGQ